jgi:Ca2+:H+ antiporter
MTALKTIAPWILVVVAIVLEKVSANSTLVFIVAGIALLPLAGLMGKATEHLAATMGAGIGGLLNASFGNAAELIIAFMALQKGHLEIVKASITGSIIGNSLLVLGLAVLTGGLRHERQKFNNTAAGLSSTLLALSAIALILPATFHHMVHGPHVTEEHLSLVLSVILIGAYALSLLFTLKTHKHLYVGVESDKEEAHWSRKKALALLALATTGVALLSEVLVGQVEHLTESLGLNEVFVGVMLLAVIGNAAEHSTAVIMAYRNRMDIALGIAMGSSIQIALFVAPVLVFAGLFFDKRLDLVFSLGEVVAVSLSAWIVSLVAHDGETHWMEGVLLLTVYVVLGVTFFFLPVTP